MEDNLRSHIAGHHQSRKQKKEAARARCIEYCLRVSAIQADHLDICGNHPEEGVGYSWRALQVGLYSSTDPSLWIIIMFPGEKMANVDFIGGSSFFFSLYFMSLFLLMALDQRIQMDGFICSVVDWMERFYDWIDVWHLLSSIFLFKGIWDGLHWFELILLIYLCWCFIGTGVMMI